ncbi:uncharacterized protein N7518_008080 [Penicillium psychrosexuale]|uniref:uncharacterized protein n=1 Tax=Penicillium psychrosexuale TaxID=1002107 RepID=UPI0025453ED1|nr:uncharacterized protein N7518_008080 [Penicillium psychrosexuale]KAJ5791069.1 hypothetical protein N7518_008080 [Penicillium psychrosexuale]
MGILTLAFQNKHVSSIFNFEQAVCGEDASSREGADQLFVASYINLYTMDPNSSAHCTSLTAPDPQSSSNGQYKRLPRYDIRSHPETPS